MFLLRRMSAWKRVREVWGIWGERDTGGYTEDTEDGGGRTEEDRGGQRRTEEEGGWWKWGVKRSERSEGIERSERSERSKRIWAVC